MLSPQCRQNAFHIGEPSELAAARRGACALAVSLGFDETATGALAIAVTEAGTNIAKYASSGEILVRKAVRFDGAWGIEILAIDAGPGIASLAQSMRDGVSTSGTYGIGLGTMRRLADRFDIYTAPGQGTAICMTFWREPESGPALAYDIGVVCLPIASETVCGDAWAVRQDAQGIVALLADGLGHGPTAATASEAATMALANGGVRGAGSILRDAHQALQGTRGAAVGVARLDSAAGKASFAGVGNIAGCVLDRGATRHLVSHNGIVGSNMRKVQEFDNPWSAGMLMIMHSDGIKTRWDLDRYPGLETLHPALIAAVLYRDFKRGNDDVTVLVCRERSRAQ